MKKRKSAIKGVNDWTLPKFRLLLTIRILSFTRRSRERSVSLLNFQSSYFVSLSIVIIELQSRSSKAQTSTNLITFSRPKHFIFKMKKFDAAKLFFFLPPKAEVCSQILTLLLHCSRILYVLRFVKGIQHNTMYQSICRQARHTFWSSFNISKRFYDLCLWARGP